jgi:hypothetical protein
MKQVKLICISIWTGLCLLLPILNASEDLSNTSLYYTNSLKNQFTVRQDFDRIGGGFGSFEVHPENGLELLSDAPNFYSGVRVFRSALPANRAWAITARAHVQLSDETSGQVNPWYGVSLGLVKRGRESDGSTSILKSAPYRFSVALAHTDLFGSRETYFSTEQVSNGEYINTLGFNLGNQTTALLRLRYLPSSNILSAEYSLDEGATFSDAGSLNLENEWNLTPEDELIVTLGATSPPYTDGEGSGDFFSVFDTDSSLEPSPQPIYSVLSGQLTLSDINISYAASPSTDFDYEILNQSEVIINGYLGSDQHVSVPQFINELPVTKIATNAFSYNPNLLSVILPESLDHIAEQSFAYSSNLSAVYIPPSVQTIGDGAFLGSTSLRTVQLPASIILEAERVGVVSGLAYQDLVQHVGNSLADNELFMAALVSNEKFLGLLTAKILSRYEAYGLAARSDLSEFATKQDVQDGLDLARQQGTSSVLDSPNDWQLYTKDQIQDMSLGNLILQSQPDGAFLLNYEIEQSDDLVTWTPYKSYVEPLTLLPTNKKFLRIRIK